MLTSASTAYSVTFSPMVTVYFLGAFAIYFAFSVTLFAGIVKVTVAPSKFALAGRPVAVQPVKV